jgi:uridine phosphorylase
VSQPIITPRQFLGRDAPLPALVGCTLAVAGFCRISGMQRKLAAEMLPEGIFSHLGRQHQFVGHVAGKKVLALECLYGGPMSATVVEELTHYGIKTVIGYGYAGSLTQAVPVGEVVLAGAAIVSDGTSREYLPDVGIVHPDPDLAQRFRACAAEAGMAIREGTVWTTDAIYREYPEKVAAWREAGADVVNMDTAHFYAVSNVLGMSAVYACVVSDCVEGPAWDDGFARAKEAMSDLQDLVLQLVATIR